MTALHGDEAELFEEHNDHLLRVVRSQVVASEALIEDACATAWEQFMRCQPARGEKLFGWLRTVAIREAWRLSSRQRRESFLQGIAHNPGDGRDGGWEDFVVPDPRDPDLCVRAKEALELLAGLPERQRRYLGLLAGGHRYEEIMRLTGATYTNVNKHLTRARAGIRMAQEAA
jgi:DNA-directed RNA polymerase specialized sigma24 family protein